jgi:hypothetical protein
MKMKLKETKYERADKNFGKNGMNFRLPHDPENSFTTWGSFTKNSAPLR